MDDLQHLLKTHSDSIIRMRRDLHRIPETAYTEAKTAAYVADRLRKLGLEVRTGIARYGVLGTQRFSALRRCPKPGSRCHWLHHLRYRCSSMNL